MSERAESTTNSAPVQTPPACIATLGEEHRPSNEASASVAEQSKTVYGGCEGPDAMYVKLVSTEGHEFIVKREHALISETIAALIHGPGDFGENETNVIELPEIPGRILQKVCMFFEHKAHYAKQYAETSEFLVEPEIAVELLYAANFLGC